MSPDQLVERENRYGRIAGIVGIAGVLFMLVPPLAGLGSDFNSLAQDEYAARFEAFEAARDDILLSQILQAVGVFMFAAPLYFLFDAASARSDQMKRALIGLTVVGPLFFAISMILYFQAYDSVASSFIDNAPAGADLDEAAKDALTGESTYSIFGGLQIAGLLSIVVAIIYTSLYSMRVGLLTRFLGTLGMALGAGFVLIGPLATAVFILIISPLIARFWPGTRPPAWEAGEAIPWPTPGAPPPDEEELADPTDFVDGEATELPDDDSPSRPGRRENKKKRKRKQRG